MPPVDLDPSPGSAPVTGGEEKVHEDSKNVGVRVPFPFCHFAVSFDESRHSSNFVEVDFQFWLNGLRGIGLDSHHDTPRLRGVTRLIGRNHLTVIARDG